MGGMNTKPKRLPSDLDLANANQRYRDLANRFALVRPGSRKAPSVETLELRARGVIRKLTSGQREGSVEEWLRRLRVGSDALEYALRARYAGYPPHMTDSI
jgi:hypothetical protein